MVLNSGDGRSLEFYNVDNTLLPDCLQGTKEYPEAEFSYVRKPVLFTNPGLIFKHLFVSKVM